MTDPMRVLACGHERRVSLKAHPTTEEYPDVYCIRHGATTIIETRLTEYHAWCHDCRWGAWWEQDRRGAERAARGHEWHRRGHRTIVALDTHTRDGRGLLRRRTPPPDAPETSPLYPLDAPF